MAFSVCLYFFTDIILHKGLVRVMIGKNFPAYIIDTSYPKNKNTLLNSNKEWIKAVNTEKLMKRVDYKCGGIECDVYIDKGKHFFNVNHDNSTTEGINLDSLLAVYKTRGLKASIWLDLKNLRDSNYTEAVNEMVRLRNKYGLANKVLVESNRTHLLKIFSDSGFFTSCYIKPFNPYLSSDDSLKYWVNNISDLLHRSEINSLSCYYFQYPFLHHYFPRYPILIWSPNDRFSIVNWWYKKRIASDKSVFISLNP